MMRRHRLSSLHVARTEPRAEQGRQHHNSEPASAVHAVIPSVTDRPMTAET